MKDFIYLLIKNNIYAFSNKTYLYIFFHTIFFLTFTATIPYYTLDILSSISPNQYINSICDKIYTFFYFYPSFTILFIIHNFKLYKLLSGIFKAKTNPNHIYITSFSVFIYGVFYLIGQIKDTYLISYYISNTLSYSVFFNEIAYLYIDNDTYNYSNRIDFYNNNIVTFMFYGILTSYLLNGISAKIFLPYSFTICSIIQNSLIDYRYNKNNREESINILSIFERMFNFTSNYLGKLLLFWLRKRNMINIKY